MHRRFVLQRHADVSGVSGTGIVAEGILFSNGVVALQWTSEFHTSVVFHQRGMESVEAVHGHSGATEIVWQDGGEGTLMGWVDNHYEHGHDPRIDAIRVARKLATAVKDYLQAPTTNHRDHMEQVVAQFDREMARVQ